MAQSTFNPISDPYQEVPSLTPGKVAVVSSKGGISKLELNESGKIDAFMSFLKGHDPKHVLVGVALVLAVLWFIGLGITLLLLLLAGGGYFLYLNNRSNPIVQSIFGKPPEYYLIDIARKTIKDERRSQLSNTGIYAVVDFEYRAQVISPEEVASQGIIDIRDYVSDKFYLKIDELVARQGMLGDRLESLRKELHQLFLVPVSDDLIKIDSATFDVRLEGASADAIAKLGEADIIKQQLEKQSELDSVERLGFKDIISNDELLLAELMRSNDESDNEKIEYLIKLRLQQKDVSFQQNISLFELALKENLIEAHQLQKDFPQFFSGLAQNIPGIKLGDNKMLDVKIDGDDGENEAIETLADEKFN